jgi:uncharacterized membrane protein required for colicin V production
MTPKNLNANWFDFVLVLVIAVGILRGRKRGMSEELLDVFQWLGIVVGCGFAYRPLGIFVAGYTHLGVNAAFVLAYLFVAIVISLLFAGIKRMMGEKLLHGDTFGRFEYYLGMMAGALRFACVVLVILAFLHSIYISDAERAATARMQAENFGTITLPTVGSLQHGIFFESASGKFIRKNLGDELIQPVPPGETPDTIAKRRERAVDEAMGGKGK